MIKKIFLVYCLLLSSHMNAAELKEEDLMSAFKPIFVTAHHLFSEAGGFSREYSWKELQSLVSSVSVQSLGDENISYSTGKALPIKGAESVTNWSGKNDIAVFKLNTKPAKSLKLASSKPKIGETVWLYGLVYNRSNDQLLHKAIVVEYDKNWISYQFYDSGLVLNGTSGAAILNASGEVVGINLSGGEQDGKLYGYGNPLVSIKDVFSKYVQ